jgi:hypothetical protein
MSAKSYRWLLLGTLAVGAATSGCDGITTVNCDKEPDADICQDDPEDDAGDDWPDEDGGTAADGGKADAGKTDAATSDAGKTDAGGSDGGVDASTDGATSDGGSDASTQPLTVDEFCAEQLKVAVAWRDDLEGLCGSTTNTAERNAFLEAVLGYLDDGEGKCVTAINAAIATTNTTFDGSKAQACADTYNAQLALPPDPFPTSGIDLITYESKIGHGAQQLIQIPVCRQAIKGKATSGKTCAGHFECAEGLRCLEASGGAKTCQTARVGGTCTAAAQCADGYTCVGSATSGGGKTCVKNDGLPENGGNCGISRECATDLVCTAGKCANPVAAVICK